MLRCTARALARKKAPTTTQPRTTPEGHTLNQSRTLGRSGGPSPRGGPSGAAGMLTEAAGLIACDPGFGPFRLIYPSAISCKDLPPACVLTGTPRFVWPPRRIGGLRLADFPELAEEGSVLLASTREEELVRAMLPQHRVCREDASPLPPSQPPQSAAARALPSENTWYCNR